MNHTTPLSCSVSGRMSYCIRTAPGTILFLLFAVVTQAADNLYVTAISDASARLSNGSLVILKKSTCLPFVRHDLSKAFVQVQLGPFTAWIRKRNVSFVSKEETAAAAAKYGAETKIVTREIGSYPPATQPSRWAGDAVRAMAPNYPYNERQRHHEGSGLFHLTIDPKTGLVTDVTVRKSTGFAALDESAVATLRQWTWIPGTWRGIDFPITYRMATGPPPQVRSGDGRLPNSL